MTTLFLSLLILFAGSVSEPGDREEPGHLKGTTYDRETGEPLGFVYLHLEEINRTRTAHADGAFEINNIPEGDYTLTAYRMGYQTVSQPVTIPPGDTLKIDITLKSTVLSSEAIEVVGVGGNRGSNLEHASKTVSGTELRQNLGTTLAKTMDEIAGVSSRSMGSASSRPVIRGLGGERVLILQDGERTGDVSSQSADHAVTVDPMAAEEIEIARGPAALQYGSNAIGGVVNVVRNQILTSLPDHIHGTASIQGESVNTGGAGGVELSIPLGDLAVQLDGNLRGAGDVRTPSGTLENSDIFSTNNAAGFSLIQPWGYTGASATMYHSAYGIPPDPEGGHEDGVAIDLEKYTLEAKSEYNIGDAFIRSVDIDLSHKTYHHTEEEAGGMIGTEFGLLTTNLSAMLRHGSTGVLDQGTFGVWGERKDYAVRGTNTPDSKSNSLAAWLIEEKDLGSLHLEGGLRFDMVQTIPEEEDPDSRIGHIRERSFAALASSASAILNLNGNLYVGTTLMHSFRAPSQEELYSEGPHLASYSYEVGNPDLDPERGFGAELFVRYRSDRTTFEVAGYQNLFSNYIYPRNTGQPSVRFPSLNVYQFTGADARFHGVEATAQLQIGERFGLNGNLTYTRAQREVTDQEQQETGDDSRWQPLPMIPPLQGSVGLQYASGGFRTGGSLRLSAEQTRTGDFETATDGYAVAGVFGQYRFATGDLLHAVALNVDNLFDTTYRSHLSRIKDLVPEPGRNISLLYRVFF